MGWLRKMASLLRALFLQNVGIKVLSIGLAAGLWFFVNAAQRDSEQKFPVSIRFENTPTELMLISPLVDEAELKLSGPRTLLSRIDGGELGIVIDLSGVRPGMTTFRLRTDRLELPRGVTPIRMTPSELTLELAKVESKRVPVDVAVDGRPEGDLRIVETKVSPEQVDLEGPARIVREFAVVKTVALDLSDAVPGRMTREVALDISSDMVTASSPVVNVEVVLEEPEAENETSPVEIIARGAIGRTVIDPPTVKLLVRGARSKVESLRLPDGAIYVEASDLAPGTHRLVPQVVLPAGVELVRAVRKVKVKVSAPPTQTPSPEATVESRTPAGGSTSAEPHLRSQTQSSVVPKVLSSSEVEDAG